MKDSEFIELLNLYLDHEISAPEAARLESEVQTNPARRRVYHQYCRMQKACKLAAGDFCSETEIGAEKKVVAFEPHSAEGASPRKTFVSMYTVGTFAAVAACIAIIVVGRNHSSANRDSQVVVQPAVPTASVVAKAAQPAGVATKAAVPHRLVSLPSPGHAPLVGDPLLLTGNTQAEAVLAAAVQQANDQLKWIESVQLAPLQQRAPGEFRFDATFRSDGRALGGRAAAASKPTQSGTEEMAAFQFRR